MKECAGVTNANESILSLGEKPYPIDILNREPFVEQLMEILNMLSDAKSSCTFAINAPWGAGKTFVLDILERQLQDYKAGTQYLVFHYNCWQYDYYNEPLIAIVSSMLDNIDQQTKIVTQGVKTAGQMALEAAKPVVKNMATSFAKNKFGIDIQELSEMIRAGQDGVEKVLQKAEEEHSFDAYYDFKNKLTDARKELLKLSEEHTVVIVVDELDRCQPDYAIKTLERLHHLFCDLENIIVILSIDGKQLDRTVKHIFGDETEVSSYLMKFINFEIELGLGEVNSSFREKFSEYISLFDGSASDPWHGIDRYLSSLFSGTDMRTLEHMIRKLQTIHKILFGDKEKDLAFMCFELLLAITYKNNSNFEKAPFYYKYDQKKQCYTLYIDPSLPKSLIFYVSSEWDFQPRMLQNGHGRYPQFDVAEMDIPHLLIVYSNLLFGHDILVKGYDEIAMQETIADLRKVANFFNIIK